MPKCRDPGRWSSGIGTAVLLRDDDDRVHAVVTVAARSYALVVQTEQRGATVLHRSTVCEDLLVRADDGSLRVRDRKVTRDDIV